MGALTVERLLPKVIIHNSVSIDGSLTNFEPNMELHYQIAGSYRPDVHLVGSNTVKAGIELYGGEVCLEEEKDFEKPVRAKSLPYWVIPDTNGVLKGLLHTCRDFEFCKDVIVLISEKTSQNYVEYLQERNYDHHVVGKEKIDLRKALNLLSAKYKVRKVLADTGRILGNLLLNQGFASELSILIHPVVVGAKAYNIFGDVTKVLNLKLQTKEILKKKYVWLVYKIIN